MIFALFRECVIWFLQVFLLQLEAGRNFETFIVEYLRPQALFKHWQKYHENSNKDKVWSHFHFPVKVKNPLDCPFSPPSPLSSSCWLFCPLGSQHKFSLQGPPNCPLTHRAPCSRPLCKCADFGAVEPRNLGDFRSNFNGGEILRASLLLSPRLIFSSK